MRWCGEERATDGAGARPRSEPLPTPIGGPAWPRALRCRSPVVRDVDVDLGGADVDVAGELADELERAGEHGADRMATCVCGAAFTRGTAVPLVRHRPSRFEPAQRPPTAAIGCSHMAQKSQAVLVEFSGQRLLPEVEVFFAAGRMLTRTRMRLRPSLPWLLETSVLEAFALHARSLIDFFFTPSRWPQDALASHFFEPGRWEALRPKEGPWIELVRGRVGKEIAHLRYDDVSTLAAQARGWPVLQLAGAVGAVLRVFIEAVPRHLLSPGFVDAAWREIPVFARVGVSGGNPPLWPRPTRRLPAAPAKPRT